MKTPTLLLAALALAAMPIFAGSTAACPACEAAGVESTAEPDVVVPAMLTTLRLPAGGEFTIESEPTLRDTVIDQ